MNAEHRDPPGGGEPLSRTEAVVVWALIVLALMVQAAAFIAIGAWLF